MENFMMGAIAMATLVAGIFFLRFWRQTRDRLFLIFALAFWLLGLTRVGLVLLGDHVEESQTYVYLVRLGAYVLILVAIIDKNRSGRKAGADEERSMEMSGR
jgi:Ca2+/Na+ antiporter